ncbi:hypothetical protein MSPP1_002606 [Malassezia sp. CBS 17886]|nr:hypothetical protein MSPP1_002606 [Malassezia sp. CBS 17886]
MLDERKLARQMAVPTLDSQVRVRLREVGAPMTLFGEREADRRARLVDVMVARGEHMPQAQHGMAAPMDEEEEEEEFYTEGPVALLQARRRIAAFSLAHAKARIAQQRREADVPLTEVAALRKRVFDHVKTYTVLGSQVGGERPISVVRFSPDAKLLATGGWSGSAALWSVPNATQQAALHGHEDRVTGLAWHPRATLTQSASAVNLATGGGDGVIRTWGLDTEQPLQKLVGHEARVARIAFHPTGAYLASASFDGTWRLWDVERAQELQLQEGHSREVYAVDFQCDGALIASGGLDAIGRVWDARTGRTAMVLDGHAREVLSMAFAPNGYQIASSSGDDTVKIWDLRKLSSVYTIPAHRSSVADVRFFSAGEERRAEPVGLRDHAVGADGHADDMDAHADAADNPAPALPRSGLYMATAGYDGLVKVWSADDWQLIKSLSGDSGKVMSVDISSDGQYLASGEWARTFKLWGAL